MKARHVGRWLRAHLPAVDRVLRPAWRAYRRLVPPPTYWSERQHYAYYRAVVDLARTHAPGGGSVLDVGAGSAQVVDQLTWFTRRVALDRRDLASRPGVEHVVADFMDYRPPEPFDLVLCLEVLEHLEDPEAFARKLLATGACLVVSVPYRWPAGTAPDHRQDPVDEAKLAGWMGGAPRESRIVRDGRARLVGLYMGGSGRPPSPPNARGAPAQP